MELKDKIIEYFFNLLNKPHVAGSDHLFHSELIKAFNKLDADGYSTNDGNIIITVPATGKEYKNKPAIILQTHLDMPAIMAADVDFDFKKDLLTLKVDDNKNYISSEGTNFGATNAIAIIYMLLLLQEKDFNHPEMVFIITRDKELAMSGATKIDMEAFKTAKYLINLDYDKEGDLILACSGSEVLHGNYTYRKKLTLGSVFELEVSGLTGSWANLYTTSTLGNPAKILAHILFHLMLLGNQIQIVDINCRPTLGRTLDRGTMKVITQLEEEEMVQLVNDIITIILPCYSLCDPQLKFVIKPISEADKLMAFDSDSSASMLFNLLFLPNGVEFNNDGVPLASSDILYCFTENDNVLIGEKIKFVNANYNGFLKSKINMFYSFSHARISEAEVVPPYVLNPKSKFDQLVSNTWKEQTGKNMKIRYFNGVLENGLFKLKLPDIDIVSIGPTVENAQTVHEKLDLNSAVRVYELLKKVIENISKEEL